MSIKIKVPDIGIDEAEVTDIMVKVGDKVNIEQSLITIEGEKVSIEIPSPYTGIVKEIKISIGDKITTGNLIMIFDHIEKESNIKKISFVNTDDQLIKNELKEVILPDIGINEIEITDIIVKVGDNISIEQELIIIEVEQSPIKILAPFDGKVKEIKISKGDKIKTGSVIMIFEVKSPMISLDDNIKIKTNNKITTQLESSLTQQSLISSTIKSNNIDKIDNESIKNNEYVHATPLIRRIAREFGINLSKINGTGLKGRILREDIQNYIKKIIKNTESKTKKTDYSPTILPWPKIDFCKFGNIEEVELSRIQKISSANLSRNWVTIPHVTIMEDADITELESFRKEQNKEIEKLKIEVKITLLTFVIKAVAQILKEMPNFNASISVDAQRLIFKKYINIGIAIDTINGLMVPVIRDVNKKGIIEIAKELLEISKKARSGKLIPSDMQCGNFTISNLGGIGTTRFTPIINAPEVAILGLSRSSIKPIWNGNEFISRLILPMSLSFDHRIINGADGARFIIRISQLIGDIRRLIM
ncbi:MAG: pyruvate dehydrogenase complex dihydrolipoyllysine-residue acetyltransferase [Arsenophonus endosymbiont of Ceratovacuna japonica]